MKEHYFTLILASELSEEDAEALYGAFNDGTASTIAGISQIHFHREARSLEDAIRSALSNAYAAGIKVQRVEIAPESVLSASDC